MAIGVGIGTIFKSSASWSSYWASQSEVLFYAKDATDIANQIVDSKILNQKKGTSDYLTVTGTPGKYVFSCPNNETYVNADTDALWFRSDGSLRGGAKESELKGYDFTRTIVKYGNTSPFTITEIMIVSSDLTGANKTRAYTDFQLSVWWDDTFNSNGQRKDNRGFGKSSYTSKTALDTRSASLLAQMAVLSETQTDKRAELIDDTIKLLKANSLFDTKFNRIIVYRAKGNGSRMLNWIADAFNSAAVANGGTLTQTDDLGCHSDGTKSYIRTNFNPRSNGGALLTVNNASIIYKFSGALSTGTWGCGVYDGTQGLHIMQTAATRYPRVNDSGGSAGTAANNMVSGFNGLYRAAAAEKYMLQAGKLPYKVTRASLAIPNAEMYALTMNTSGSPDGGYCAATTWLELEAQGGSITGDQFNTFCNIFRNYFENL